MIIRKILIAFVFTTTFFSCEKDESNPANLELERIFIGSTEINQDGQLSTGLPLDQSITLMFSSAVDPSTASSAVSLKKADELVDINITTQNKNVVVFPSGLLEPNTTYTIVLTNQLKGVNGGNFVAKDVNFKTAIGNLELVSAEIGGINALTNDKLLDVPLDLSMSFEFTVPVAEESFISAAKFEGENVPVLQFQSSEDHKTITITGSASLKYLSRYKFSLSASLKGMAGEGFAGYSKVFYTTVSGVSQFPEIPDDELLTKVQQQTFKYFWDFGHPDSGMARERNTSGDIVTTGGSGFGVMAILVGIKRNFITRAEGIARLTKIVNYLAAADRFHGAWPHWLNGSTGEVVPFGTKDDGGDLVETAFMIEGLLAVRAYLDESSPDEKSLIEKITDLWETVEWDWYTQGDKDVLYWHWSPNYGWEMNMPIRGYNEALIVYVLAASSPTHSIAKDVYTKGWAQNGGIVNGKDFFNIELPLGYDYGGPLFFAHYSFLGLDPRELSDQYANYWTQNVHHAEINQAYCIHNPKSWAGYSEACWGLTASDNQDGYSAHSPTNDLGVITPTAALSSFPYTPEASMKALHFFYYSMGDRLWGEYGFYDAFNVTEGWTADSYIAIDQGPIIAMIENYRSGMLWDLFMTDTDVQNGLDILNFSY